MSVSFVVQATQGRRHTARVNRDDTMEAVLRQACTKLGLTQAEWALQHGRKLLDDTVVVRMANLPNNAKLELVPRVGGSGGASGGLMGEVVTVVLQLPDGTRVKQQLPSSMTLWGLLEAAEAGATEGW